MKTILASAAMLLLSACATVTEAQMFAKPVHCAPDLDSLIEAWEDENVYPLVALGGVACIQLLQSKQLHVSADRVL